jgi:hypothetical protein
MHPEHTSIGELAYRLWQARGCPEGSAERDWLDAEKQLQSAQRAVEARAAEPTAFDATDRSLQHEAPANTDAKWKAAGASRTASTVRSRRSKSAPGKPSAEPPR